ncbi:uncharacterized protein M437DRAFT_57963 [Aureobasidium melanogenum CBS 110374]|uniref:Galactose oxidase n=1 Tax=Aureobasidium melanogenum (strain CBS 110374) TaxID=1043003 RepID=A0A074W8Z4_AURM1|nr:uncharacterized protein M437DRAFT_57963 [Aureobasidium melanogenum CBS 110374]KEQ59016.1 hypothetical protein M437DRAFT_57963 [Aureobasidium melanogenum CBS 110374]
MSRPALSRRIPVVGLLALATAQVSALDQPYNPTHIVIPEQNDEDDQTVSYAYILQPNANGQASLLSLDLTNSLEASKLSLTTLYDSLPFLETTSNRAYTPLKGSEQNITVVAGDCSTDGDAPEVWTFIPATHGKNGNGTWLQSTPAAAAKNKVHGPDFLSSGIAFSDLAKGNASTTSLYVFGGMCPLPNATDDTWMSAANYTNQMMTFSPELDSSKQVAYTSAFLSSKGPPVAEAGFSMTPLSPAFSDNSSSTQSARQSFVLVGGHTGAAFINMSSVALFSLPEETWTYQPVDQPSAGTVTSVEPRSGHTAVLTEDGKSLVVFGGWVGDVTNAASPQLAVLELGSGYGGDGDWEWSVPSQASSGLAGAGIYGHGAAMLPGGVMMIMGGYNIPTTSSKRFRFRFLRRSTSTSNSQTLFYNVTSKSWIQSYDPPPEVTSGSGASAEDQRKGALTTTSQKAGLGVGLAIGGVVVILLIVFYFWYKRHLKRRREARESDRERLSTSYEPCHGDYASGGNWQEKDEDMHDGFTTWTPHGVENSPAQIKEGNREVERSGLSINAPSPTRGLRKNGLTRSQYQYHAAPRYDDGRISRTSGHIHPIQERDEEEERLSSRHSNRSFRGLGNMIGLKSSEQDPFKDPLPNPLRSHPVTPEIGSTAEGSQERTISPYPASRSSSPDKIDERTSSGLSENSDRSGLSSNGRSVARTSSTRSGLFFGLSGHPSITPSQAPSASIVSRSLSPAYWENKPKQTNSLHPPSLRPGLERAPDSSSTQCTTFGQLIAQSEALLGTAPEAQVTAPLNYKVRRTSAEIIAAAVGKTPPLPPRRRGWMGSIRQVFSGDRSMSASHASRRADAPAVPLPTQQYRDRSNSPVKSHARTGSSMSTSAPRRAASDSSQFLGTRRGKRDWEGNESDPRWQPYRDDPDTGDWGDVPEDPASKAEAEKQTPEDEREDWDIEEAAANRDVQVMFTVPKARLRVVNADVDKASLRSISDGAKSIRAKQLLKEKEKEENKNEETEAGAQRKPSNYGLQIQDWEREALEKRDAEEAETSKKN